MFRDIVHKLKIFFCDEDIEKIYVRDSTVIRNNEVHKMYDEILNELGDLATVVSRNYVYGRIKDRTGFTLKLRRYDKGYDGAEYDKRDIHVVCNDIHVRVDVCHADIRYRV